MDRRWGSRVEEERLLAQADCSLSPSLATSAVVTSSMQVVATHRARGDGITVRCSLPLFSRATAHSSRARPLPFGIAKRARARYSCPRDRGIAWLNVSSLPRPGIVSSGARSADGGRAWQGTVLRNSSGAAQGSKEVEQRYRSQGICARAGEVADGSGRTSNSRFRNIDAHPTKSSLRAGCVRPHRPCPCSFEVKYM